jgi:hypothetical protein
MPLFISSENRVYRVLHPFIACLIIGLWFIPAHHTCAQSDSAEAVSSQASATGIDATKGEWIQLFNGRDIDDWIVKLNHHDVNDYDPNCFQEGKALSEGFIALQSEGQPIDFRKVELKILKPGQN